MGIRKLPTGKFQADYYYRDSRLRRRKKSFLSKKEAAQWERRGKLQRERGPETRTVAEAIEDFKRTPKFQDLRESSKERYLYVLKIFQEWCDNPFLQFDQQRADAFGMYLRSRYKNTGVTLCLKIVSALFANEESNPFKNVPRPKNEYAAPRFFTEAEIVKIFSLCTPEQKRIFSILLYTGMRTAELINLLSVNVTPEKILIRASSEWMPKTPRSVRDIPVPDPIKEEITDLLSLNHKYLLGQKYGKFKFYKWYMKIREEANLPGTNVHTFRKTYGSLLLQNGVPIAYVSRLMGHDSITTTEKIYTGLLQTDLDSAVKVLRKF